MEISVGTLSQFKGVRVVKDNTVTIVTLSTNAWRELNATMATNNEAIMVS